MYPASGSKTAQGYELQLGVNNIGTGMFTELLTPTLISTAKTEPANTVRVVWVASSAAELPMIPTGGVDMATVDKRLDEYVGKCYCLSKSANVLQALEYSKRHEADGILSVSLNPGNLASDLWRTQNFLVQGFLRTFILHPSIYGAYTELFAGLSPDVKIDNTPEKSGKWSKFVLDQPALYNMADQDPSVGPWGRFVSLRKDLPLALKSKDDGGHGTAAAFWDWTESQWKPYL